MSSSPSWFSQAADSNAVDVSLEEDPESQFAGSDTLTTQAGEEITAPRPTGSFPDSTAELAEMYNHIFTSSKRPSQIVPEDEQFSRRCEDLFDVADLDGTGYISEENHAAMDVELVAPLLKSVIREHGSQEDVAMQEAKADRPPAVVGMDKKQFADHMLKLQDACNAANPELFPFVMSFLEKEVRASAGAWHIREREKKDPGSEHFDLKALLTAMVASMGGATPGITVCMKNLAFETAMREATTHTVASAFEVDINFQADTTFNIFENLDAICRPGELTLIIGPPGSGKSTLLKALSCRYRTKAAAAGKLTGDLQYNGVEMNKSLESLVNLILPFDEHLPLQSVGDTFQFIHDNSSTPDFEVRKAFLLKRIYLSEAKERGFTTQQNADLLDGLRTRPMAEWSQSITWLNEDEMAEFARVVATRLAAAEEIWNESHSRMVEIVLRILRLSHVKDTCVGDAFVRGVSGGERRRVSFGEALVKKVPVLCCDEITNGLDANAALAVNQCLKTAAQVLDNCSFTSLLQPSQDVYECYDRVIMLNHGKVVYSGKRTQVCDESEDGAVQDQVLAYFDSIGLAKPSFLPTPDFLDQVTGGEKQTKQFKAEWEEQHGQPWDPANGAPPTTPDEFAACWKSSKFAAKNTAEVQEHLSKPATAIDDTELESRKVPFMTHFKSVTRRQWKYTLTDIAAMRQGIVQSLFLAVLAGTLFLGLSVNYQGGQSRAGLIFFINTNISFGTFALLPSLLAQRGVFYKHSRQAVVNAGAYMFANVIAALPVDTVKSVVFASIIYWLAGFQNDAGKFFFFVLLCWMLSMAMSQMTRAIGACSPSIGAARALGPLTAITMMCFSGYLIPETDMKPWAVWIYYISPLHYSFEALMINELRGLTYPCPTASSCPSFTDGESEIQYYGYDTEESKKWVDLGVLFGFWIVFLFCNYLGFEYIRYDTAETAGVKKAPKVDENAAKKPTVLAEQHMQVALSFSGLTYDVPIPNEEGGTRQLRLLQDCFGYFVPGSATCLMGSSGAGKTTLMDVIAGMKTGGKINGDIWVNHEPLLVKQGDGSLAPSPSFRRYVGYVEQSDIHLTNQTIREAFHFSAATRLPTHTQPPHNQEVSEADRAEMVQYTLDMLDLRECADVQISLLDSQQLKRCTMGVELVADPAILFLDEPTSGLDSIGALTVMESIKKVVASGVTVICTIHQPSETLFNYFDNLLLLKKGGYQVYFGPCPKRCIKEETIYSKALDYFQELNGAPSWTGNNPADYILEFCAPTQDFDKQYAGSSIGVKLHSWIDGAENSEPHRYFAKQPLPIYETKYALCVGKQNRVVLSRALSNFWRSPDYNSTRMITAVFTALFLGGMMYPQVPDDTLSGCNNRVAAIFMSIVVQVTSVLQAAGPIFKQRAIHFRERQSLSYREIVYFTSSFVVEVPYIFVAWTLFTWILFFTVGLNTDGDRVVYYAVTLLVYMMFSVAFGQFIASVSPTETVGTAVAPGLTTLFILCGGFLILPSQMPSYWKWLYWISPIHYALEGLVSNEISGRTCGPITGDQLLSSMDLDYDHRWRDFFILLGAAILFRIGTFLALSHLEHIKR